MVVMKWLNRLVSRRRTRPSVSPEPRRERWLKVLRLEQRRVLNADFTFDPNLGLSLANVDGNLTIREVDGRIEFDLAGSDWNDVGHDGFPIDHSVADRSILSFDRAELAALSGGLTISGADDSFQLTFDTRAANLDLQFAVGGVTVGGFGEVHQVGTHELTTLDLSIRDADHIEFQQLHAREVVLSANEIDFGGSNSISGMSLTILPGESGLIELGGQFDRDGALNFTDHDISAVGDGFGVIRFGASEAEPHESLLTRIDVHNSDAAFDGAIELHGTTTLHGSLLTTGDAIHVDGQLVIDGSHSLDTTGEDLHAAGEITIHADVRGLHGGELDRLTLDASRGALDGVDDARIEWLGQSRSESSAVEFDADVFGNDLHVGGTLDLAGGSLTAMSAGDLRVDGDVVSRGGSLRFEAGSHGALWLSGLIDVSDEEPGQTGGDVRLLGEQVGLVGQSSVNADGWSGGGTVLIGGDFQGANSDIANSRRVFVGSDVSVTANATESGNGGRVIIWSDEATQVFGHLTARGGATSGDGGLIETSSREQLIVSRGGDASAVHGQAGTWLLDPLNVTIRHSLSVLGINDNGQLPNFTPTASGSEVTDVAIEAQLSAGTNVVISTEHAAGDEAGNVVQLADARIDVVFASPATTATFTILAANDIVLAGGITAASGSLDVVLRANTTPDDLDLNSGDVSVLANIHTNGGSFASSGVGFDSSEATIVANGGITIAHTGTTTLGTLSTGAGSGGTLFLKGAEAQGTITVGDGNVSVDGGNEDLVILSQVSASASIDLQAIRDVVIRSSVTAGGLVSDLSILANSDAIGSGGVWLDESSAEDAKLSASRDIMIQGSLLAGTAEAHDAIRIDGDGTAQQVVAGRDLTLVSNASHGQSAPGDIWIEGRQTATSGSLVVFATDRIVLGADQSAHLDLLLKNDVQLTADVSLHAGRDVTFTGALDDDGSDATGSALEVSTTGAVIFVDPIGANVGDRLDSLTIQQAGSVDFLNSVAIDGDLSVKAVLQTDVTEGTVHFQNRVTTTAGLASGSVTINNDGLLTIGSQADFRLAGDFAQIGAGSVELAADVTATSILFSQAVLLKESVRLDTRDASGDITFLGSIDSEEVDTVAEHNSLFVTAGAGVVSFNGDLGAGTNGDQTLGQFTIESARRVLLGGGAEGSVNFTGRLETIATDGEIQIGTGANVITDGIVLNAGFEPLRIVTTDDAVRFNGAVTLASSLDLDTNFTGEGGSVTFTSAASIDSEFDEANNLTIDVGLQRVSFNNSLGANQSLGTFTIIQADSGVFFGESDSDLGPGTTGPVLVIATDGAIDIGTDAHVIHGGIVLNAGLDTLRITTTDDTVRLNGRVTLESSVHINTVDPNPLDPELYHVEPGDPPYERIIGGTVTFTSSATIDSQDSECNDLIIDAGSQQVLFNANLGVGVFGDQRLGHLTITQADDGVIFGESDFDLGPGTTGPVTAIATCDEINIGVGEHIVSGTGIVFNAGSDTLQISTTDDRVRFNGAVTLSSALTIDTNFTPDEGGGTVTFTSAASIDSEFGEANALTIDAGTQQILFNNDLGASQLLGALTITQADFGVRFGQAGLSGESDLGQLPQEMGFVAVIAVDGPIDIGVGAHVVEGGIVLNAGDDTLLLTTTDDTIRFNGPVMLASGVDINTNATPETGGATVTFTEAASIDSQYDQLPESDYTGGPLPIEHNNLTIDVGVAQVLFNNSIGVIQSLGEFTITRADFGVIFGQSDTNGGPGTTGPVEEIHTDGAIDIGSAEHVIEGAGIILNAGSGTMLLTTTDDSVRFNGAVTLMTGLDIDTNATGIGGAVTFTESASIDSQTGEYSDLTIDAGTEQVVFNNNLGESQALGTFTIEQADAGVIFGESDTKQGPGTTGPVAIISTFGPIDIGVGDNVVTGGIVLNSGEQTLQIISIDDVGNGDPVPDESRPVRFNGAVTLGSDVEIDTNSTHFTGGRTVIFTSAATIDSSPLVDPSSLTIDAGSQQVLFNNDLGATNPLGRLTIVRADAGVIFGETDTDEGPGTTGPVTTIATDDEIDIGVGENVIGGTGIVFNAGDGTLFLTTTDDPVRINGAVTLETNLDINTNLTGDGGSVRFTSAATIDSQSGEHNELVIDAGMEFVFFNNNIGETESLALLTITQADSGVFFGESDIDRGPGTTGPVSQVITEGPIDLGVGDNIITGGIHIEGGVLPDVGETFPENTTVIESREDSIRINGVTTSRVDLVINAAEGVILTNDAGILTNDLREFIKDDGSILIRDHSVSIFGDTDEDQTGDVEMGPLTVIDTGDGFIDISGENVVLGELLTTSTNTVTDANPAVRVVATVGSISDAVSDDDDDPLNIRANAPGAGVVLGAVLGIGSGNALETDIDSLVAFNHDLESGTPAEGNIEIRDIGAAGGHTVNVVFVHNQANALETGDPDNGVIDINVESGDLVVLADAVLPTSLGTPLSEPVLFPTSDRPLLDALISGIDPGDLAVAAIESENTIRLVADNMDIQDDIVALDDTPGEGGDIDEKIDIKVIGNFSLQAGRVITTDDNYSGSLPAGDPTQAEPVSGEPPSTFPLKPRVTGDRVDIVADYDLRTADAGYVFLGQGATISTDAGLEQQIARRPEPLLPNTAFYDHTTILASDLETNGLDGGGTKYLGLLTVVIGRPGEKNLIFDVDWGDTPRSEFNLLQREKLNDILYDSNVNPPSIVEGQLRFDQFVDKNKTRFFIPEGGLTYVIPHEYSSFALNLPAAPGFREPGRLTPSDPFQVRFAVSQHLSMQVLGRGIREPTPGPPEASPLALVQPSFPVSPLAILTGTDVIEDELGDDYGIDYTDVDNYRLNSGVAEFNIPTTKAVFFIPPQVVIPPPELPKPVVVEPVFVAPPQITTETTASVVSSSSITTEEWFELRRLNEDGTVTVERLNDFQGEGLLEKERFEKFISDRGDGEYEIWFITRESGGGAMIERPVIRFRLEGGRLAPPPDDSPKLFKPFRLIPIPAAMPQDGSEQPANNNDANSDAAAFLIPNDFPESNDATVFNASDAMPLWLDERQRAANDAEANIENDELVPSETTTSASAAPLAAGVAMFAVSRRWNRSTQQTDQLRFSKAARWSRQRASESDPSR